MHKLIFSAPGRVFLNGDPARYKERCIAASIDSFNYKITDSDLHKEVKKFVETFKEIIGDNRAQNLSLQAFFFLLICIACERGINITSFVVKVSTELAIGEGLGSSASFATCLAACFYHWSFQQKYIILNEFNDEQLAYIWNCTKRCESVIYNSSTAIDSVISVYGSMYVFYNGIVMERFFNLPSINILLVSSNVSQKTTAEQSTQSKKMMQYPFIESIRKGIDNTVEKFNDILKKIDERIFYSKRINFSCDKDQVYKYVYSYYTKLSILIQMNQGLLKASGMSHPNLDTICAIARSFQYAGKFANDESGYVFILIFPNDHVDRLIKKLQSNNFPIVKKTSLNCSGLRIVKQKTNYNTSEQIQT